METKPYDNVILYNKEYFIIKGSNVCRIYKREIFTNNWGNYTKYDTVQVSVNDNNKKLDTVMKKSPRLRQASTTITQLNALL